RLIGLAKAAAEALDPQDEQRDLTLARLAAVRADPGAYLADPALAGLARECLRQMAAAASAANDDLRATPLPCPTWRPEQIEAKPRQQMDTARRRPVAVAGALMPDARPGYGVPIGAVLATEGAVVPYAVGVDIACRMRLSVYPISPIALEQQRGRFERALQE